MDSSRRNWHAKRESCPADDGRICVTPLAVKFGPRARLMVSGGMPKSLGEPVPPTASLFAEEGTAGVASQSKIAIDALILKGGGVKGLAFAGAMRELEGVFEFNTFVGTSAGAIAAALFASGASGAELEETFRAKNFRDFLDGKIWLLPFTFWSTRGLHPGYTFVDWLREELHKRIPQRSDIQMQGLPKRAVIYGSTRRAGAVTFDSIGEHKDTAVHTAVRCSMSIPYFFQPQWIDNRRVYDGGLLNNYPIQIFLEQEQRRNPSAAPPTFIGLYLGSMKPDSLKPGSVFEDLMSINIERNDSRVIDEYKSQTIVIDTDPIGTTDFDLTDLEKEYLVIQGRNAAFQFLTDHKLIKAEKLPQLEELRAAADPLRIAIEANRQRRQWVRKRAVAFVAGVFVLLGLIPFILRVVPSPQVCRLTASLDTFPSARSIEPLFLAVSSNGSRVRYPFEAGKSVELTIQPKGISWYIIALEWSDNSSSSFEPLSGCKSVTGRKSNDGRSVLRLVSHR
jgi:predicted acylesterase/phospholipase RssA